MEPFDLKMIAAWLMENELMEKRFCDMDKTEITDFCEQVHIATDPLAGNTPPYINDNQELIIPYGAPDKYRWWKGGQSIKETLEELGAPEEIKRRYLDQEYRDIKPSHQEAKSSHQEVKNNQVKKEIFVIDIETTHFSPKKGSIVEVGIVSLDLNTGEKKVIFDSLCQEKGMEIDETRAWIFQNSDLHIDDVLEAPFLGDLLPEIQRIIDSFYFGGTAFNKTFDFSWLESRGIKIPLKQPCPMRVATPVVKIPKKKGSGYKWPTVEEAWDFFFPKTPYIEKHRGADDALHEADIVLELFRRGSFKLNGVR